MKNKKESEFKKIEKEAIHLAKKVRRNIAIAISAAFAFVIALVWRDAIQEGVNKIIVDYVPVAGYLLKIISAVFVTIICVTAIIIFSKWSEK